MRLGEMLVHDGRLTEAQLVEVLAHQGRDGGRVGTVLVELGLIDLDALTVYLGLELGIPIATGAMLERAKRAAVRLLSPEQAFRYKCVPLIVQDRQLIAAVENPHDLDTLDALGRLTGYRVIPRIAPEIRIYYYVERYYGIPRPARFVIFGDGPRGHQPPVDRTLPAPPLPGLPPVPTSPINAPTPPPILRRGGRAGSQADIAPPPPPPEAESQEALELEAEDLLVELETDDAARAEQAPVKKGYQAPDAPPSVIMDAVPEEYEPMGPDQAVMSMSTAEQRGDIAEAVMAYAGTLFDVATLFIVKDNLAMGWKALGDGISRERIECLLIPLDSPSMFHAAIKSETQMFHDAPAPATVHTYFFKVLRTPVPGHSTIAVIAIGKRVVNLLYGHRRDGGTTPLADLDALRRVSAAAANAYARLIAGSKHA